MFWPWKQFNSKLKEYYVVDNFLENSICDKILNQLSSLEFDNARQRINGRYNKELFISEHEVCYLLEKRISDFSINKMRVLKNSLPFEFYKYDKYDFIKPHNDASEDFGNNLKSNFTAIIYLNDDFEGGETNLITSGVSIIPKKGRLLLFTQSLLHEACIINSGTKYIYRSNWLIS
jgi:prolyl 4-hydroxylase